MLVFGGFDLPTCVANENARILTQDGLMSADATRVVQANERIGEWKRGGASEP